MRAIVAGLLLFLTAPAAASGQILQQSWVTCGGTIFDFCFLFGVQTYETYMDWSITNLSGAIEGSEAGAGIVSIGFQGDLMGYDPEQKRYVEQLYHTSSTTGVYYDDGSGSDGLGWLNLGAHTRNLTTQSQGYATGSLRGAIFSACWNPEGESAWITSAGACVVDGAANVTFRMERWFHNVVWDPVRNGALTVVAQLAGGERSVWSPDNARPACGCGG